MNEKVKLVLGMVMWACVSVGVTTLFFNLLVTLDLLNKETHLWWLPAFMFAGTIAGYVYLADGEERQEQEVEPDGYRPRRAPQQNNGNNAQFAMVNGNGLRNFTAGWGNTISGVFQNHGWLIAGLVLAISTAWFGYYNHSEAVDWTVIVILILSTGLSFLAYAGELKNFLTETGKNHLLTVWLVLSILAAVILMKGGYEDGYTFWTMPFYVWMALLSTIATGMHLMGILKPFLKGVGEVLLGAYTFKYHTFLTLVLWGVTLIGLYLFSASGEVFGLDVSDEALKVMELLAAGGWFMIIFAALAFKKK